MSSVLLALLSISGVWAGSTLVTAASAEDLAPLQPASIKIPAQPMRAALAQLAAQTGLQLIFPSDIAEHLTAPALNGVYTPRDALKKLLADSPLAFEFINERTAAISSVSSAGKSSRISEQSSSELAQNTRDSDLGMGAIRFAQKSDESAANERKRDDAAEENKSGVGVQEVIVTATRREQRVQDVPVSMAVVTADEISQRGLVDSEDYLRGIPGVNQLEGLLGQAIVIRGIETQVAGQNFNSGPTTATYFGETPTTNSGGLNASNIDIKLVDIERVEVLRGPQGTAFGNSSMGGAVRIIPAAPKLDRWEAKFGAGYGSTSGAGGTNYDFHAAANLPVIRDRLAVRAVAYTYSDSGYYKNRAGSDPAYQASFVVPFGAQAFAMDEDEVGAYRASGARLSALYQATDKLKFSVRHLTQKTETDGFAMQTSGYFTQTLIRVAPEHVYRGQTAGVNDYKIDLSNGVAEYDLGWADILGSYSHIKAKVIGRAPYGAQGIYATSWAASAARDFDHREDIMEVRLVSKFNGPWNFLAGLYKEKQYDNQDLDIVWHGDQAFNPFGQRTGIFDYLEQRDLRQKAAFGEVSWDFLPRFTLTAGVRAYKYEREVNTVQSGPLAGGSPPPSSFGAEESGETFRANLSFKPRENTLLYAGFSQGLRLGKPQEPPPSLVCDTDGNGLVDGTGLAIAAAGRVDSDSLDNYELGAKLSSGNRFTVDTAIFRMNWDNIPVTFALPCGWPYLANAGSARSEGIELQASFRLTESLRADFGGSHVDARLTKDAPGIGASSGARLAGAPKINANLGLQYQFNVAGHSAYVRADGIYVGSFYGDLLETPTERAGDYVKVDASARVSINNLDVDFYVRNITDEDAFTYRGYFPSTPIAGYRLRPRTFGVQLGYEF